MRIEKNLVLGKFLDLFHFVSYSPLLGEARAGAQGRSLEEETKAETRSNAVFFLISFFHIPGPLS